MGKKKRNKPGSLARKRWMVLGTIVFVFVVSFFLPTSGPKEFVYFDALGTSIPVVIEGETRLLPKEVVKVFGQFEVSAYWDCACTSWVPMDCGPGTCNVYHGSSLFDSYPVSCIGGIDQDGRGCAGCCWRIDCTWINPTSPPTINVNTSCGTPGNAGWCRGGAVLNITADEPQGDPMTVTCTTPTVSATGSTTVGLPEGTGTANCNVTSANGSDSDSAAWQVDTIAPTNNPGQSGTMGSGGWYTSNVTVSVTGTDTTSGVASRDVRVGGVWYANSATVTTNGENTVRFRVVDNAGNTNAINQTISIDKVAPSLAPSITGDLGSNGWYTSNPTINVGGSDAHSGVATERANISGVGWQNSGYTIGSDGTYTLNYGVTDIAGHTSTGSGSVNVDATDPGLSVSLSGGGGSGGWYTSPLTASVSGSDAMSGLNTADLQVDGGGWVSGPVSFNSEGVFTLEARSIDNAGNITTDSQQIRLDMTNPGMTHSVNGTLGNNGWYVSAVNASVTGTDSLSGVGAEEIRINGGGWGGSPTTLSSEGSFSIDFRVTDVAGNLISAAESASIDLNPPVINNSVTGSSSGGYFTDSVTVTVGATDSPSGVASEEVRIDGGAWVSPGTFSLSDGSHTIEYRAEDNAGHVSTTTETIQVDATPPSVSLGMPNSCSGDLTFSGTASDPSGVSSAEIVIDGTSHALTVSGSGNWSYSTTLSNGGHNVVVNFTDSASNVITESGRIYVDNNAPDIDLETTWESWDYGELSVKDNGGFNVTITGTGPKYQGKNSYRANNYPDRLYWRTIFPSGVWGKPGDNVRVIVTAEDNCGNVASKSANIVILPPGEEDIEATSVPTATPVPTKAPPEPPRQAKVQPTAAIEVVEEAVEVVEEPRIEPYHFPLWIWALLASAMVFGVGGIFIDPRPKQVNRLAKAREERLDLFVDTYEE